MLGPRTPWRQKGGMEGDREGEREEEADTEGGRNGKRKRGLEGRGGEGERG